MLLLNVAKSALLTCLVCLVLAGCASSATPSVSWQEALEILESEDVESVFQYHSRVVILMLKDGREVKTRSPRIDLIFDAIEECGTACEAIQMVTE